MDSDELYISYFFPPSIYAAGIISFKRILELGHKVDVLQGNFKQENDFDDYVNPHINNRHYVNVEGNLDLADFIFKFIDEGLKEIGNNHYEKIYSMSWLMANHFLACEYKIAHPDVFWSAEFSDPLIFDTNNNIKSSNKRIIDDEYISRINNEIQKLNDDFPLIESNASAYLVAEYIVYLFADEIIFTNENQREIMIDQFPFDIKDHVMKKSIIKPHPTIKKEFYHIKDVDLGLDDDCLNIAYFGNDYYSKRHFESLFYAVESLNHEYNDKIKVYMYISDDKLLKKLVPSDNFIVKKPMDYLNFLNATTQFDVLIVNDMITKGNFKFNPYLPSKLSDYLGSGRDIWALYEKGSPLSGYDLKYKSDIRDYDRCLDEFRKILEDNGFADEDAILNTEYYNDRLTDLNELYIKEFKANQRLRRQIKKLKKENKSSNSWKITERFRKIRK